jgi:hypothetical protein
MHVFEPGNGKNGTVAFIIVLMLGVEQPQLWRHK